MSNEQPPEWLILMTQYRECERKKKEKKLAQLFLSFSLSLCASIFIGHFRLECNLIIYHNQEAQMQRIHNAHGPTQFSHQINKSSHIFVENNQNRRENTRKNTNKQMEHSTIYFIIWILSLNGKNLDINYYTYNMNIR